MIKGLIFDVDGVIINTENTHFLAYRDVFRAYAYDLTLDDYMQHFSGKSIRGGVMSLVAAVELPGSQNQEEFIQAITEAKINQTVEHFKKQVVYFDDALVFIDRIAKGDVNLPGIGQVEKDPVLAMATGLESVMIEYVLDQHQLRDVFSVVVTADQYTHSKPHPECYQLALSKMNLLPNQVIGFEDSLSGIKALNAADVFSVAVTNTHLASELREAKVVTEALSELF